MLAHVVTFTNLGCGFAALLLALEGHPNQAVSLLFLAMVLDFLDGALARMAGHGSAFGKELDSLADLVSFGVAPAFLAYQDRSQAAPSLLAVGADLADVRLQRRLAACALQRGRVRA